MRRSGPRSQTFLLRGPPNQCRGPGVYLQVSKISPLMGGLPVRGVSRLAFVQQPYAGCGMGLGHHLVTASQCRCQRYLMCRAATASLPPIAHRLISHRCGGAGGAVRQGRHTAQAIPGTCLQLTQHRQWLTQCESTLHKLDCSAFLEGVRTCLSQKLNAPMIARYTLFPSEIVTSKALLGHDTTPTTATAPNSTTLRGRQSTALAWCTCTMWSRHKSTDFSTCAMRSSCGTTQCAA